MRTRRVFAPAAAVALLALAWAGCAKSSDGPAAGFRTVAPAALTAAEQQQWQRAQAARDQLAQSLLNELTAALAAGPEQAIAVCSERAPALAAAVGKAAGVQIGRTSARLRNPQNAAPEWALAQMGAGLGEPACLIGPAGQLAAMFPIRIAGACLQCHGPTDQLGEPVRAALQARYPADRAVGYAAGDLRGWFVVEVPL